MLIRSIYITYIYTHTHSHCNLLIMLPVTEYQVHVARYKNIEAMH